MSGYEKRGYLNTDFRLFHLTDTKKQDFSYHYHDFDKIILFLRGRVSYFIEGRSYDLKPFDLVLVHHNDIHRPDIDPDSTYERIILYLSPGFLTSHKPGEHDLSLCFQKAREQRSSVLRIPSMEKSRLFQNLCDLEKALNQDGYAEELFCQVLFLEFMIRLNRTVLAGQADYLSAGQTDPRISAIMDYIGSHLTEELSVDTLANRFYLSRYHFMRLFKQAAGYTVGSYITEKRLLLARDLLRTGMPVTEACFHCGFQNYSTFSRAYRKYFGGTPTETKKQSGTLLS